MPTTPQQGTPKTLSQAIENGLGTPNPIVEAHVQDFIAQVINAELLLSESNNTNDALARIWVRLTAKPTS